MNIRVIFALVIFVLALSHSVQCQAEPDLTSWSWSTQFFYNGDMYTYKLSKLDLVNTPSWNADDSEPPLSLRKALDIARKGLLRFGNGADKLKVLSICLEELPYDGAWIYDVKFHCSSMACKEQVLPDLPILIKMDGSIIEPEKYRKVE